MYLSVPIGSERVEFNAHRIFYASTIIECFGDMKLYEFSCCDNEKIEYCVDIHRYDNEQADYKMGLFYFIKK